MPNHPRLLFSALLLLYSSQLGSVVCLVLLLLVFAQLEFLRQRFPGGNSSTCGTRSSAACAQAARAVFGVDLQFKGFGGISATRRILFLFHSLVRRGTLCKWGSLTLFPFFFYTPGKYWQRCSLPPSAHPVRKKCRQQDERRRRRSTFGSVDRSIAYSLFRRQFLRRWLSSSSMNAAMPRSAAIVAIPHTNRRTNRDSPFEGEFKALTTLSL